MTVRTFAAKLTFGDTKALEAAIEEAAATAKSPRTGSPCPYLPAQLGPSKTEMDINPHASIPQEIAVIPVQRAFDRVVEKASGSKRQSHHEEAHRVIGIMPAIARFGCTSGAVPEMGPNRSIECFAARIGRFQAIMRTKYGVMSLVRTEETATPWSVVSTIWPLPMNNATLCVPSGP